MSERPLPIAQCTADYVRDYIQKSLKKNPDGRLTTETVKLTRGWIAHACYYHSVNGFSLLAPRFSPKPSKERDNKNTE